MSPVGKNEKKLSNAMGRHISRIGFTSMPDPTNGFRDVARSAEKNARDNLIQCDVQSFLPNLVHINNGAWHHLVPKVHGNSQSLMSTDDCHILMLVVKSETEPIKDSRRHGYSISCPDHIPLLR